MSNTQRILLIAGISGADPRTVAKQLAGKPAHGAVLRRRIEEATNQVDRGEVHVATENRVGRQSVPAMS